MSLESASQATSETEAAAPTGLPGVFRTWKFVYGFVVAIFVLVVALLAALPYFFA